MFKIDHSRRGRQYDEKAYRSTMSDIPETTHNKQNISVYVVESSLGCPLYIYPQPRTVRRFFHCIQKRIMAVLGGRLIADLGGREGE